MIRIWEKLLGAKRRAQKWTSSLRIVDPTSPAPAPPATTRGQTSPPPPNHRAHLLFSQFLIPALVNRQDCGARHELAKKHAAVAASAGGPGEHPSFHPHGAARHWARRRAAHSQRPGWRRTHGR